MRVWPRKAHCGLPDGDPAAASSSSGAPQQPDRRSVTARGGPLQGELLDGEPLFPGESDIDQLYRIQQMLGPLVIEHRLLFEMHPAHHNISFPIAEPQTLAARYSGHADGEQLAFLEGLLHLDPKKRLGGEACLRHAYLRDLTAADADVEHVLDG